jgi:hypothetical protein
VVQHIRPALFLPVCEAIAHAPLPPLDHVPLCLQSQIYARDGVELDAQHGLPIR